MSLSSFRPRVLLLLAFLAGFSGSASSALTAQAPGARPSPADSAAVLLETASEFDRGGEADVARALLRHIVARYPGTPAAARAETLLEEMGGTGRASGEPTGSVELQVWSTLYGLWLGVAVPAAFGASDTEPYGVGLLVGGPAGFLAGRMAAGSGELTLGQVRAITLGGTWGTWQGFGWREVFDWGVEQRCFPRGGCGDAEDTTEETLAAMIVGGLAGLGTGAILARGGVSSATATGANFGSLWGTWFGAAAGVLADLEDDDLLAASLAGGNAGLVAGALATPRLGWSRDRWRVVSIAGVLGGLGGLGIDLLVQPDDHKTAIAIPLVTSLVGLGIGVASSRGVDAAGGRGSGDGASMGALFSVEEGAAKMNPPVPYPILREVPGPWGPEVRAGLGLTLFQARF